jgi:hypothetical protein
MQKVALTTSLRRLRTTCFATVFALLVLSGTICVDWSRENVILRRQAREVTKGSPSRSDAIIALNHWVYGHEGFAKNHNYFLLEPLGPTPLQILHSGGDCSDKSRLLSALLYQIGISSGLVMIYPCATCGPIHTVVEANYDNGRMVVDPIWNVDYPAGGGKYYGVRELAGTDLGRDRVMQLRAQSSPTDKIALMPDTEATFDYAVSLNWNKNAVLRASAAMLRRMNVEPGLLLRPRIMEDPKLAMWVVLLVAAVAIWALGAAVSLAASGRFGPRIAGRRKSDPQ